MYIHSISQTWETKYLFPQKTYYNLSELTFSKTQPKKITYNYMDLIVDYVTCPQKFICLKS